MAGDADRVRRLVDRSNRFRQRRDAGVFAALLEGLIMIPTVLLLAVPDRALAWTGAAVAAAAAALGQRSWDFVGAAVRGRREEHELETAATDVRVKLDPTPSANGPPSMTNGLTWIGAHAHTATPVPGMLGGISLT